MNINIDQLKKKIIYRSNYRGTKEMDKLLGAFATVSGSLGSGLITPVAATITPIITTVIKSIRLI